ncbi:MAG: Asp-tRNA(Asn)/Glu-tRNA(Gln) amidotransferase subunit GatC [Bacteroidetes bacterium]|nr:Asp-tRNA(Asn)/Glu-tRNA(Gln) amidotransferase subunit GatC [Bacteroidota bacterium]
MSLSKKDIEHIAKLAKLKFTDEEMAKMEPQLNSVLEYMDKLSELDTDNVEPLSHPVENINVFRDDILKDSISTEDALRNAPKRDENYFKVPKVISND